MTDARWRMSRHGRTLLMTITGLVTAGSRGQLSEALAEASEDTRVRRVIVDLLPACMAMTRHDWMRCAAEHLAVDEPIRQPMAVLVPDEQLNGAWDWCEALTAIGRIRVAFGEREIEDARLWAGLPAQALTAGAAGTRRNMPWLQPPRELEGQ